MFKKFMILIFLFFIIIFFNACEAFQISTSNILTREDIALYDSEIILEPPTNNTFVSDAIGGLENSNLLLMRAYDWDSSQNNSTNIVEYYYKIDYNNEKKVEMIDVEEIFGYSSNFRKGRYFYEDLLIQVYYDAELDVNFAYIYDTTQKEIIRTIELPDQDMNDVWHWAHIYEQYIAFYSSDFIYIYKFDDPSYERIIDDIIDFVYVSFSGDYIVHDEEIYKFSDDNFYQSFYQETPLYYTSLYIHNDLVITISKDDLYNSGIMENVDIEIQINIYDLSTNELIREITIQSTKLTNERVTLHPLQFYDDKFVFVDNYSDFGKVYIYDLYDDSSPREIMLESFIDLDDIILQDDFMMFVYHSELDIHSDSRIKILKMDDYDYERVITTDKTYMIPEETNTNNLELWYGNHFAENVMVHGDYIFVSSSRMRYINIYKLSDPTFFKQITGLLREERFASFTFLVEDYLVVYVKNGERVFIYPIDSIE